jgi:hypothetical protein
LFIFVDGRLACQSTRQSASHFEKAYKKLFPKGDIEVLTASEATKLGVNVKYHKNRAMLTIPDNSEESAKDEK